MCNLFTYLLNYVGLQSAIGMDEGIFNFFENISSVSIMVIIRQNIVFASMLLYLLWYIKAYLSVSIFQNN
jgi:hypothetical protein